MTYLLRGAMVEYGSDFLGLLPNIVVFQFNPESISRTIEIPPRPTGSSARETSQAGDVPVERFSVNAEFDAADHLNSQVDLSLARLVGVGPQLAALEKMVYPTGGPVSKAIGAGVDAVAGLLGRSVVPPTQQKTPRQSYPRILFVWGLARLLPVIIESMTINELEYDFLLNPTRAQVAIGLAVNAPGGCTPDGVARGAMLATSGVKDAQAVINQAQAPEALIEMIPF